MSIWRLFKNELDILLDTKPKAPHLLKLLYLPPKTGFAMLKNANEPFSLVTDQGVEETFNPKDYSQADISWAEQAVAKAVEGQTLAESGQFAKAIPVLKEALQMAPGQDFLLLNLGVCYAQTRNFPDSIKILEKARSLYPNNTRIQKNLEAIKQAAGKSR